MKLATTLGSIGVCALLASCAIGPDYRPPEPATALQWQAALPHGGNPAALIDWWKQFDDPLVAELITLPGATVPRSMPPWRASIRAVPRLPSHAARYSRQLD